MPKFGEVRVDFVTFTTGVSPSEANVTASISGLIKNPTFSGDVIVKNNLDVEGNVTISGTVTGNAAGFTSITGTTVTGTTANFVTISGTTVTGNTGNFTTITTATTNITSGIFASGTAAAPSVSIGTTSNGLYSPGSDQVAISTSGTGRLFIDNVGNVGAGTSNPQTKFHARADGDELKSLLYLQNRNGGANAGVEISFSNSTNDLSDNRLAYIRALNTGASQNGNHLTFGTNANGGPPVERMRIDSLGDVRIGANGGARLTVTKDTGTGVINLADFYAPAASQNGLIRLIHRNAANTGTSSVDFYKAYQDGFRVVNNDTDSSNYTSLEVGGSEALRINSSSNVGIGTSGPGERLTVIGPVTSASNLTNPVLFGNIGTNTNSGHKQGEGVAIGFQLKRGNDGAAASTAFIKAEAEADLGASWPTALTFGTQRFGANPVEHLRISSTGNVGIGTASPSSDLDVFSTGFVNLKVRSSGTNTAALNLINSTRNYSINSSGGAFTFFDATASSERMRIDSSGRVGIGTTAPTKNLQIGSFGGNDSNIQLAASTTGASNILFGDASDGDNWYKGFIKYSHSSDLLQFYSAGAINASTGGSERLRIDSSGRLLVQSSSAPTQGLYSQYAPLTVQGYIGSTTGNGILNIARGTTASNLSSGSDVGTVVFSDSAGGEFARISCFADAAPGSNDYPGRISFHTSSDGASSPTERMRIDRSGNVGIGTTGPTEKLFINDSSNNVAIELRTGGASFNAITRFNADSTNYASVGLENTALVFRCSNNSTPTERARIDNAGRLLVGTSTSITGPFGYQRDVQFNASSGLQLSRFSADVFSSRITFVKSKNATTGQHTAVVSDDALGEVEFAGSDGSSFISAARITAIVNGTPGTNDMPGALTFATTADGASSPTEKMRIDNAGLVGIGTTSMDGQLEVRSTSSLGIISRSTSTQSTNTNKAFKARNNSGSDTFTVSYRGQGYFGAGLDVQGDNVTFGPANTTQQYQGLTLRNGKDSSAATTTSYVDFRNNLGTVDGHIFLDHLTDGSSTLIFGTTPAGARDTDRRQERMRITGAGNVLIRRTVNTDTAALCVDQDASGGNVGISTITTSTASRFHLLFRNGNGQVGSIATNGSATSFNTSSDYRLKENVVDLGGAIDRVKQLAPKRFNFIADPNTTVDGFLAHEAQTVVPEAVTGTYNKVDDNGNAVMQGIDQSKLVPLLTAALQEAIAKIETLETEVSALKNN